MSRTIQQIQAQITATYVAALAAINITVDPTKWSKRNKQQLSLNTFSVATATFEQNLDAYTVDIESDIASASPQTAPWIQNQVLNVFQYDSVVPQIPQLDIVNGTFAPFYNPVDATKRIITQCVVVPGYGGITSVKVAKSTGILSAGELSALSSFLNIETIPGMIINASSGNSDKIYINGVLTYLGGYSAIIQSTVVAAIQKYLSSIPTSGIVTGVNSPAGLMKLTDLIAAVRAVPGVIDFELENINARPNATPFVLGVYNLVSGFNWLLTLWQSGLSGAGYMQLDNTTPVGTDGITNITYTSV